MSRVRSNFITNRLADGAPTASLGLIISGVTTTTTLDTNLIDVDKIEVTTAGTNVAVAVTHNGTGDLIRLYDGTSQVVTVDDEGKVGIGTDSPDSDAYIHIVGQDNGKIILEDNSNNGANLRKNYIGIVNSDNLVLAADEDNLGSSSSIRFRIDNTEKVRITGTGRVGIGTDNPVSELHVSGLGASDEPTIRVASENSTIFLRTAGSSGSFPTGGTGNDGEMVYIGGDFRFGIGTASKNLIFFNGSGYTERLRIGSTGYVSGNINVPCWFGKQDTAHNVTNAAWTAIINLGNDAVNPSMNNGGWDESTGTFTVQAGQAGTYYVFGQVGIDDIQSDDIVRAGISKNDGTPSYFGEQRAHEGEANQIYQAYVVKLLNLNVGDTVKLKVYHNEGSTEPTEPNRCYFGGYRIAV